MAAGSEQLSDPDRKAATPMKLSLPDVVTVTGTSAGLGLTLAQQLIKEGVRVVGIDLHPANRAVATEASYVHITGGVDDLDTWAAATAAIRGLKPTSLGLAQCAAMLVQGTAEEVSTASWQRIMDVNILGVANGINALGSLIAELGGGSIVLVGSVSGIFGEEHMFAYCATKGAVGQMTRAGALDYGRRNVRVNMVSPGPMATEMFYAHMREAPDPEAFVRRREDRQPLGAILAPEQVANTITFLLADESDGITGVTLPVDGGLTAGFEFRNLQMSGSGAHHGGTA